jgi:8-oxo-dGTP pyrophosphatase MutT (NUDIX family)
MIRRHERASFVPNAWVFPGGMMEPLDEELAREIGDGSALDALRITGARELFEETGIWLGAPLVHAERKRRQLLSGELSFRAILTESPLALERLVWTSHWITPVGVPKRFDTLFFLAKAPPSSEASVIEDEAVDSVWTTPAAALTKLQMVFPTIRNLEAIARFATADELIASRRGVTIEPIQPRIVGGKIVLP